MAFRETCAMEERIRMLSGAEHGGVQRDGAELSERYGVSRETFYLWRERRLNGDAIWFQDRSHAPRNIPGRTEATMIERIVALRHRFPHFGPKKLRFRLQLNSPELDWPALSTIGDILARAGLVEKVRRQRRPIAQGAPAASVLSVNSEWCVDFKGWFRTRDGRRIDPLTVTDNASRYLLEILILRPNHEEVRPVFERLFRDFGLPDAVRSDNGPPFGSSGAGGLSRLSIWLLKLGVEPHFGRPARRRAMVDTSGCTARWRSRPDATAGALRERTAAALRCVSPALQRGASARGAGAEAAGANLVPLLAADARADRGPLVRRPSRGPTRPHLQQSDGAAKAYSSARPWPAKSWASPNAIRAITSCVSAITTSA